MDNENDSEFFRELSASISQQIADQKRGEDYDLRKILEERPQELCDRAHEYIVGGKTDVNGVSLSMMPRHNPEHYPENIQKIAKAIGGDKGIEDALWFIAQCPHTVEEDKRYPGLKVERIRIYVPTKDDLKTNHLLVKISGWDNALKIVDMVDKADVFKDKFIAGRYLRFAKKYKPEGQRSVIDHAIMCAAGEGRLIDATGKDRLKDVRGKGDSEKIIADYFDVSPRSVRNLIRKFKLGEF